MGTIIALAGQKGGSSRSTVTISIASEWHARGKRLLIVDADPQGTIRQWGETAASNGLPAPTIVAMGQNLDRPDQLPALAQNYDLTVIDCPPGLGPIQRAALMVADVVIMPCGPSAVDAWAMTESLAMVGKVATIRPELDAMILVTRTVTGTKLASTARNAFASFNIPVLDAELGYRVAYQEAPATGHGVAQFAPTSNAAHEIRMLVDELDVYVARHAQKKRPTSNLVESSSSARLKPLRANTPPFHYAALVF